jgi:16S rRNA (cytidine1402-2'-O)-methyltransferase
VLLERHGISARLLSYHEHNEAKRTAELLPRLEGGERVALVSDAGLPGINDPGARLIAAALEAGVPVTILPGPSAVETALVASGLVAERYQFVGYLPRGERALLELADELSRWPWPVVAFESPQRLARSLTVLTRAMPERQAAVCRELTKRFEEVGRGTVAELAERFAEPVKGEVTLVLGAGAPAGEDEDAASAAVAELVAAGTPRRAAADVVARLTGVPRNRLYRASL